MTRMLIWPAMMIILCLTISGVVIAQESSQKPDPFILDLEEDFEAILMAESDWYKNASDDQRIDYVAQNAAKKGGYDVMLLNIAKSIAARMNAEAWYVTGMVYTFPSWRADSRIPQNDEFGAIGFTGAAKLGHPEGHYQMGECLLRGRGVPKNWDFALEHYEQAGSSDVLRDRNKDMFVESQYKAGWIYLDRAAKSDSSVDRQRGIEWMQKAADNGDEEARQFLKEIKANEAASKQPPAEKPKKKSRWSFDPVTTE